MSTTTASWALIAFCGLALFITLTVAAGMYFHTREPRTGPRMSARDFVRGIRF